MHLFSLFFILTFFKYYGCFHFHSIFTQILTFSFFRTFRYFRGLLLFTTLYTFFYFFIFLLRRKNYTPNTCLFARVSITICKPFLSPLLHPFHTIFTQKIMQTTHALITSKAHYLSCLLRELYSLIVLPCLPREKMSFLAGPPKTKNFTPPLLLIETFSQFFLNPYS